MADKKYIDYPFTPVPTELLQNMIDNQDAPLSHRILCVLFRELFSKRKKEITISYICKVLGYNDRRHVKRAFTAISKIYQFQIDDNGQGKSNYITCARKGTSKPVPKKAQEPVPKKAQEPVPKKAQEPVPKKAQEPVPKKADTIESRIDSIERKRIIEITGDEWC